MRFFVVKMAGCGWFSYIDFIEERQMKHNRNRFGCKIFSSSEKIWNVIFFFFFWWGDLNPQCDLYVEGAM